MRRYKPRDRQRGVVRRGMGLALAMASMLAAHGVQAAVLITQVGVDTTITFDAVMSGVWGSASATGSAFAPAPNAGSPYDSDTWAARAGTTANTTLPADGTSLSTAVGFGGTVAAGAVSRGVEPTAGFGTSGLGIASGLPTGKGIGFGPRGNGTDNATVFLKVQNVTGGSVRDWRISYDGFYIDTGPNATPVSFAYSTDGGSTFSSSIGSLGFTTPGTGSVTTPTASDWVPVKGLTATLDVPVANNGYLILRWTLGANYPNSSEGNRIALDNITITIIPEPGTLALCLFGLLGLGRLLRLAACRTCRSASGPAGG